MGKGLAECKPNLPRDTLIKEFQFCFIKNTYISIYPWLKKKESKKIKGKCWGS